MTKYFFLSIILGLLFSISVLAQNSDLTWQELKKQQTEERVSLENMQKETLNKMVEVQKLQLDTMKAESSANANDILLLVEKQTLERKEIAKVYSEERIKLLQTHAEERKLFLTNEQKK
ncbi:MAG TPA: hypothetical protein VF644_17250 [Pyrinomonadaceae bacterium]|jgi:hypothetical protein